MSKKANYYVVVVGRYQGIGTWTEAKPMVTGFRDNVFQGFYNWDSAVRYAIRKGVPLRGLKLSSKGLEFVMKLNTPEDVKRAYRGFLQTPIGLVPNPNQVFLNELQIVTAKYEQERYIWG